MIDSTTINKQSRAYELSFLIENILRVSMHNIMVKKVGLNYFNENSFPEYDYKKVVDQKKINVANSAKQRRGTERKYNISLGYDYPSFWYLDFSVLISLIDVFWDKYFHEMIKTPSMKMKSDIILRLKNIFPVRNAIAHHRYISNIDIKDLESLFSVLKVSLNKDYIANFSDIALNSFESLVKGFIDSGDEIKEIIRKGKYIDGSKLIKMKSAFSAVISVIENDTGINKFEQAFNIIAKYNKLPRKPGRGDEIESFKQETKIEEKISSLMKLIGDFI